MLDKTELEVVEKNYLDGNYDLASEGYAGMITLKNTNPHVYVNKAVSEFKEGHYGAALVDLYRAKKIIPRNKKLNMNLEIIQDELNLNQPNLSFLNYLSVNELLIILLITNILFVFRWRLSRNKIMRFIISFIFTIVLLFSAYSYVNQELIDYAVVQSSSLKVYSGNSDSFSEIGELLEGQVVNVKTKSENWVQISFNKDLGWVREENIAYF